MKYSVRWGTIGEGKYGYELDNHSNPQTFDTPEKTRAYAEQRNKDCQTSLIWHPHHWRYHFVVKAEHDAQAC